MTTHSDHRNPDTDTASDGTREAIWMGVALFAIAAIVLWFA